MVCCGLFFQVDEHLQQLEEISERASKEHSLERTLDKMEAEWAPLVFETAPYRDTGTSILKGSPVEDAQMLLDDHIVKVQTMSASPYATPFMDRIVAWEKTVTTMQGILEAWLKVQATWLYLEPIFGSEDIMQQMPVEGGRFQEVDKVWRELMESLVLIKTMLEVTTIPGVLDKLTKCNESLEVIQKGLNQYLETKRLAFPRFFFLSNDELLEILSETKDPLRVQPFLKKCFEGIQTLEFKENLDIVAMNSMEKERVEFTRTTNPRMAGGMVEKWLIEVEKMMRESLKVFS
ncbi:hypothetical protein CBR_g51368 [Chara braunii]|uniref:Dynein heavy chain linker domain-containing protein n=1 Tax=Chara braunii TaxID=69332 RepID=A0A388M8S4_CHABU|nr:hypothetical protein CBR_g51368 [Chara braunii]|eukprot:GBG90862.1 hypothetical protein CBR_g51368 [Chara braunii]